jgi:peroxiredoxin
MKKINPRNLRSIALQVVFLLVLVAGLHWWQTRSLVDRWADAPSFALEDTGGTKRTLEDFSGKKVMLYFFSPWCSICTMTSGSVASLQEELDSTRYAVVPVALSFESISTVRDYAKKHGFTGTVLIGTKEFMETYRINSFPTFYFISQEGKIKTHAVGYTTKPGMRFRLGW